ncbi:MAG: glycosyltransferase family 1 protein [Patescibacteria group bacterium]|jgi:glycosyltransferase involved in cell wall biosynthesis
MKIIGIDASRANVHNRTGTEWYIFNLLEQFKTIIPSSYRVILYSKEPLIEGLNTLPVNWKNKTLRWPPKLLWTQLRLSLAMFNGHDKPDVLFIPAHTIPIWHPKKTIYVAHDLGFEAYQEIYSNSYIGGKWMNYLIKLGSLGKYSTSELDYHRWSMRFSARTASSIITISNFSKHELQKYYHIPAEKITVIYNGFTNNDYFYLNKNHNNQPPYILFVGRIEHKKNILNLIRAYALLKHKYHLQHHLKLVGIPGYGYQDILQEINKQALQQYIDLCGYVPQADMNILMNQAAAFVFPSHYEGFGIPILEALAAGTPVACSDIPALREVGGSASAYFNKDNPADIAKKITAVLQRSVIEQQQYRVAGFQQIKLFSWRKCAMATWQIIVSSL